MLKRIHAEHANSESHHDESRDVGLKRKKGLAYGLHIIGANNSTYLPQIFQQQVQDLGCPLLLVVAKLLELVQFSLCGCQCGLKDKFQPQIKNATHPFHTRTSTKFNRLM
jgi:hypothetical protein